MLASVVLLVATGMDARSVALFTCWTGAPYVGYCGLAFARRQWPVAIWIMWASRFRKERERKLKQRSKSSKRWATEKTVASTACADHKLLKAAIQHAGADLE